MEASGPRNDNGVFIVFEGIDGAGKTTQVQRLAEALSRAGEQVVISKEPTDGPWGKKLRESAHTGRLSLEEELEAFLEDRKQHVKDLILPALERHQTVILDRYYYSTAAYQGARGADIDDILRRNREFAPTPDVVVLLDVSVKYGLSRISSGRGESPDHFEKQTELQKIRDIFQKLNAQHKVMRLVNGQEPISVVQSNVGAVVLEAMKKKRCAKPEGCEGIRCEFTQAGQCRWYDIHQQLECSVD